MQCHVAGVVAVVDRRVVLFERWMSGLYAAGSGPSSLFILSVSDLMCQASRAHPRSTVPTEMPDDTFGRTKVDSGPG